MYKIFTIKTNKERKCELCEKIMKAGDKIFIAMEMYDAFWLTMAKGCSKNCIDELVYQEYLFKGKFKEMMGEKVN